MSVRSIRKKAVQQYYYDPACFPRDKDGLIYVRQSSLAQVKMNIHSFEMQTDKFIEHFRSAMGCTGHIEIIADDEALSGMLDIHKRPGLSRVVRLIEEEGGRRIGWIGAVHVNRLTRDPWLITPAHLMKQCYEHDVWIVTLRMPFDFKDDYCQRVFMLEAEESARHLQWMKVVLGGGKNAASNKGYYDGRFLSPGYIVDRTDPLRKRYIIYRPHADVISWLFTRYFELEGNFPALREEVAAMTYLFPAFESWVDRKNIRKFLVKEIADGAYKGNYKPSERGLRSILTNPVYIGWWIPLDGGLIENNHEPVIDEWLFTYAHKRLSTHDLNGERQKPGVTRNGSVEALLKKVIQDGKDNPVYAKADTGCGYYVACEYESLSRLYEVSVAVQTLDELFLEKFFERVASIDPKQFSGWEDKLEQKRKIKESRERTIRNLIAEASRKRAAVMAMLTDPEIPLTRQMRIDYTRECAGLEEKIESLTQDLHTPEDDEDEDVEIMYEISTLIPRIVEVWTRLPFQKRVRFVNALVQKVVLTTAAPTWLMLQIEWKMNWDTDICYFKAARGTGSQWTNEEEQVLWELYPTGDVQTIMTLLPDRSWVAIINHARVLQIDRVSSSRSPRGVRVEDRMALRDEEFLKAHGLSGDKKVHWSG